MPVFHGRGHKTALTEDRLVAEVVEGEVDSVLFDGSLHDSLLEVVEELQIRFLEEILAVLKWNDVQSVDSVEGSEVVVVIILFYVCSRINGHPKRLGIVLYKFGRHAYQSKIMI